MFMPVVSDSQNTEQETAEREQNKGKIGRHDMFNKFKKYKKHDFI